jgi:hypothetical protein
MAAEAGRTGWRVQRPGSDARVLAMLIDSEGRHVGITVVSTFGQLYSKSIDSFGPRYFSTSVRTQ